MDGSSVIFIVIPRVLIVGAGFAGLNATRALRHADADVTIVGGNDYHTFSRCSTTVQPTRTGDPDVRALLTPH